MHYLDYAATTPLLDEVLEAMLPYLKQHFGNPSSLYAAGREAKKGLEEAREQVADAVGAHPAEIIFTGGGTEADNLALKGVASRAGKGNVVISSVEHHAVLHAAEWLEKHGHHVIQVPVDSEGRVDLDQLADAVDKDTILVSIMAANNEVGTVQPVADVVKIVKERSRAYVHTDAVQALGKIPFDAGELGVDLAAFSAHKVGGPKGVGAMYFRRRTPLEPIIHGGGQERDLRSGTQNVAGIVGFGTAAQIAGKEREQESDRLRLLRDRLQLGIVDSIEGVHVNAAGAERLPGVLNVCFKDVTGESLLLLLDQNGVAASAGSACSSGSIDVSHVLTAMGVDPGLASGSIRFSLGRDTSDADIDAVLETLPPIIARLRKVAR